jgi:acetyl-CoA synthetase
MLRGDDPFVMLFTSGTTGSPKAVRWPLRMLLNIGIYMRDAIGSQTEDRYWNVADPGWAYGMPSPLLAHSNRGTPPLFLKAASASNRHCASFRRSASPVWRPHPLRIG